MYMVLLGDIFNLLGEEGLGIEEVLKRFFLSIFLVKLMFDFG